MNIRRQYGFTLMEIMIAMFIFAIVMAMIVSGFTMVVRSNETLHEHQTRFSKIQLAVTIITRDLSQMIERDILDNDGTKLASIISDYNGHRFEFTRGGYVNPFASAKRSTLVRVVYRFENNGIIREVWPVLDRAPSTEPSRRLLLTNVKDFYIDMLDASGELLPDAGYESLPSGILFNIEFLNKEKITRIIAIERGYNA